MQTTINSKYFGAGKSAIISSLNTEPLNADMETFRPIDFLIGGYGTCMMSIMAKVAGDSGFELSEARTEIGYEILPDMSRLDQITVKCIIKNDNYSIAQKQLLEDAATKMCPLGNSLHPDIKRSYEFVYGAE